MDIKHHLKFDPDNKPPLLKDQAGPQSGGRQPRGKVLCHPRGTSGVENANLAFIGTATTLIEWQGFRILTDPNFLHAGDHVHLGPGISAMRRTNPALDLHELPPVDCILLSHYHEDHFDRLVEDSLHRQFPIITTPHAEQCLTARESKDEPFGQVTSLGVFESCMLHIGPGEQRAIRITGMPGKHVPPGPVSDANSVLKAIPPTNGWLVEMGYPSASQGLQVGYRIYISGDTLFVDELQDIPKRLGNEQVDLMLVHLGGTTIPGESTPLIMVTMDGKQGMQLVRLIDADVTIPIHFDDYDAFLSPLSEFEAEVTKAGYQNRVVYLDRGDSYRFTVGREG
ncbi:hypothetical protein CDD82_5090 [Ophiocordyceps australis]|uniref:Metallo-beta-lactamase domain-containing protein n=1 Tax=Ophiocordyceps australis TaxID=1399860 RepID=A0A2C5Z444_9HYPO|nr:hypothetical protein CDD82_5090 [Ophiocordyceps australis]